VSYFRRGERVSSCRRARASREGLTLPASQFATVESDTPRATASSCCVMSRPDLSFLGSIGFLLRGMGHYSLGPNLTVKGFLCVPRVVLRRPAPLRAVGVPDPDSPTWQDNGSLWLGDKLVLDGHTVVRHGRIPLFLDAVLSELPNHDRAPGDLHHLIKFAVGLIVSPGAVQDVPH